MVMEYKLFVVPEFNSVQVVSPEIVLIMVPSWPTASPRTLFRK